MHRASCMHAPIMLARMPHSAPAAPALRMRCKTPRSSTRRSARRASRPTWTSRSCPAVRLHPPRAPQNPPRAPPQPASCPASTRRMPRKSPPHALNKPHAPPPRRACSLPAPRPAMPGPTRRGRSPPSAAGALCLTSPNSVADTLSRTCGGWESCVGKVGLFFFFWNAKGLARTAAPRPAAQPTALPPLPTFPRRFAPTPSFRAPHPEHASLPFLPFCPQSPPPPATAAHAGTPFPCRRPCSGHVLHKRHLGRRAAVRALLRGGGLRGGAAAYRLRAGAQQLHDAVRGPGGPPDARCSGGRPAADGR